jgi:hypothetical protein
MRFEEIMRLDYLLKALKDTRCNGPSVTLSKNIHMLRPYFISKTEYLYLCGTPVPLPFVQSLAQFSSGRANE